MDIIEIKKRECPSSEPVIPNNINNKKSKKNEKNCKKGRIIKILGIIILISLLLFNIFNYEIISFYKKFYCFIRYDIII